MHHRISLSDRILISMSTLLSSLTHVAVLVFDSLEQAYMSVDNGDFLVFVPEGGSMTFVEGDNTWVFNEVLDTARNYADSVTKDDTTAATSTLVSSAASTITVSLDDPSPALVVDRLYYIMKVVLVRLVLSLPVDVYNHASVKLQEYIDQPCCQWRHDHEGFG
jgi:hypothetical protein